MNNNTISLILAVLIGLIIVYVIQKQIREHHMQDDPVLKEVKKIFTDFFNQDKYWVYPLEKLNTTNVMNNISLYRGKKSYTINKRKVYLCLKNEDGQYYSLNMLVYVMAHEVSHVICDEIGHTEKFHEIFESLLKELVEDGIYNPSLPINTQYCELGDDEIM